MIIVNKVRVIKREKSEGEGKRERERERERERRKYGSAIHLLTHAVI